MRGIGLQHGIEGLGMGRYDLNQMEGSGGK